MRPRALLADLVRAGKVLYVGVSDAPAWWVAQANMLASLRGWSPFIGLQTEYNLIERTVERDLIPMAKALGLGLVAWSPLSSGVLTGKYDAARPNTSGRYAAEMMKAWLPQPDRQDRIVAARRKVSDETKRPLAQVALAWLRYRDVPVIPIIGARKLSQFEDNLASLSLTLTPEQVTRLDAASQIEFGFPHDFYRKDMVQTFVYGGMRDRILASPYPAGWTNMVIVPMLRF